MCVEMFNIFSASIPFFLLQHIVWYGIVLSYRLAAVHWLTFITESANVRVYYYYALAGAIYLGTYFTRCQDILDRVNIMALAYFGTKSVPAWYWIASWHHDLYHYKFHLAMISGHIWAWGTPSSGRKTASRWSSAWQCGSSPALLSLLSWNRDSSFLLCTHHQGHCARGRRWKL